jgi:Ca-activated chloride channel family protein
MTYSPEDPRLTLYALGEMPEDERADFEAGLDDEARAEIAAIRETAALLTKELATETTPSLTDSQRTRIEDAAVLPRRGKRRFHWVAWLAAAACFVVLVSVMTWPAVRERLAVAKQQTDQNPEAEQAPAAVDRDSGHSLDMESPDSTAADAAPLLPEPMARKSKTEAARRAKLFKEYRENVHTMTRRPPDPKVVAKNAKRIRQLIAQGDALLKAKRYADARDRFERVLLIDPYSIPAIRRLRQINTELAAAAAAKRKAMTGEVVAEGAFGGKAPNAPMLAGPSGSVGPKAPRATMPATRAKPDYYAGGGMAGGNVDTVRAKVEEQPARAVNEPEVSTTGAGAAVSTDPVTKPAAISRAKELDDGHKAVADGDTLVAHFDFDGDGKITYADKAAAMPTAQGVDDVADAQVAAPRSLPAKPPVPAAMASAENAKKGDAGRKARSAPAAKRLVGKTAYMAVEEPEAVEEMEAKRTERFNREAYDRVTDNPFKLVRQDPLSTFSIDVDTASYANVRRFLTHNQLPPPDAVRIEELVNYFRYNYEEPKGERPFSVSVDLAQCPWAPKHRLARVALKGREVDLKDRPASNLVFLLDVSGSMNQPNKLPLVKKSMQMLVENLGENDRVAIVVYAGASGMVLPSTSCDHREDVLAALERLQAGGSTNGGAGIQLAYQTAVANFIKGGTNRVILATDGDFNVGISDRGQLTRLIEEKAKSGVFLTVLGFGNGNLQDAMLEQISGKGNGTYAYIDSLREAKKVMVEQIGGTLLTIAKDVKIQVEFNPGRIGAYRLLGYENRILRHQDFNDDTKDAGEIGAGHTVTAFYELVPRGVQIDVPGVDALKYQTTALADKAISAEAMTVKLRYKLPDGDTSTLIQEAVKDEPRSIKQMSDDYVFATSVAAFGMVLRDSPYKGSASLALVEELAQTGARRDPHGYRKEFLELVKRAMALKK